MISARFRFRGRASLRYVYKSGRVFKGQNFSVKAIENNKQSGYRLAVVVSKKVSKSAVKRNRIRRRLYSVVRTHQNSINRPFDIVITVHNDSVAEMPAEELNASLIKLLKQANIIKN